MHCGLELLQVDGAIATFVGIIHNGFDGRLNL
jgi:hypothetical protein